VIAKQDSRWLSINYFDGRKNLPTVACCYVIYFDGELRYIGSTGNLRNRFCGHAFRYSYGKSFITPWGEFDLPINITIKLRPSRRYGDWLMVEARLIRRLQPVFNSKLKGRAR
jgi:hypothetical protein